MSRRLTRISLALVLLLSSEVWAIGLGDINLDSALNEPLRAEIVLLSATPEELANLSVTLASADTFARYGIDRPFYLQGIEFNVESDGPNGPVIQVRSRSPITEPFLTFLVEATWSSGRLLREYTVLLDPPTYSPPAVRETPAVEAPRRAEPTDSARIERQAPPIQQQERATPPPTQPRVTPPPAPESEKEPVRAAPPPAVDDSEYMVDDSDYATSSSGDVYVERGDTLWGIANRMRPDSRLTINQTMIAIFEANPHAFSGNINRLSAGVSLSIPSADDVFQISRGDAFASVKRQNEEWGGPSDYTAPDTSYTDTYTDTSYTTEPDTTETRPSLVLVPPDEEPAGLDYDDDLSTSEPLTREQEIENRIADLEAADVPDQQSLIEIRDNELASLRQELANIRGEIYEPPVDDAIADATSDDEFVDDEIFAADELAADDAAVEDAAAADETADEQAADEEAAPPTNVVRTPRVNEPSIMDRIMGILGSWWLKIGAAVVLAAGVLLWFMRRGSDDDDDSAPWETLDSDEMAGATMASTETLRAPTHDDESIVVVEQDSGIRPMEPEFGEATESIETIEAPAPDLAAATGDTGEFGSLEDTFSSETAVNLDQTDPLAEADFHMAYGLYDQAADLVNGALETDPNDSALISKLCEIYFVWGNRDAFVDAAGRLKTAVGEGDSSVWDKVVIMGQQIAADHELFAGAGVAAATKAVDLSFEAEMDEAAELDMDFGGGDAAESDIIDLGADLGEGAADEDGTEGIDFVLDEVTGERVAISDDAATMEADLDVTAEMPAPVEPTVETPTIEQQFAGLDDMVGDLPSIDDDLGDAISESGQDAEATAEINLDELDLDITGTNEELADTGINEALPDLDEVTGNNPEIDDIFGLGDLDTSATGMRLAPDETGRMPLMDVEEAAETDVDIDLLEATGRTQVLSEDMAVETGVGLDTNLADDEATMLASDLDAEDEDTGVASDAETLLAPMDDDEEEFDFAKTEALPPEAFTGNTSLDETGEMPAVARTDVDLDLDDLTAALAVSEVGDTIEQPRDDATVEQPRPTLPDETAEIPTMSIAPEDMSDDLHEARTMTEVGTKLDLARAYVDMGDPAGARSILEEVLDEGDEGQRQQAQQLLDSLPS
jgi:pilus assembly protein FimV